MANVLLHSVAESYNSRESMELVVLKLSYLIGMTRLGIGCEAAFLSFPRNEIVQVSKNVELQCSTNSSEPPRWEVTHAGGPAMKTAILFIRGNFTDVGKTKYGINSSDSGQFNLIIESVDFSYAGKYRCTEGSFGSKVEAELAVIDPYPQCQTNASDTDNSIAENDYLWMQCSVGFSGHVNLRMEWIRSSTGNIIRSTVENRNLSVLVIQVNSSDNGETFIFKVTFTQENNSRETVIEWNYTVNVLCDDQQSLPEVVSFTPKVLAFTDTSSISLDSSSAITVTVVTVALVCIIIFVIGLLVTCRAKVKAAWTSRCSERGAPVEPDVLRVDSMTHYYGKLNQEEASVERQHRSGIDCELMEPTTTANQKSQNRKITDRTVGNEGNYTELMDRSFGVQHPELYSPLHIYANSNVNPDYANLG